MKHLLHKIKHLGAPLALITLLLLPGLGWGQTTVFSDDFSTDQSATWTTSGQIGSSAFYVNRSGADWGARRNTSPAQLELTNDVGETANAAGWAFANVATSGFSSPYNTTLSSNPGLVTWYFNIRVNRANLAGFGSGSYGLAFILGSTSASPFNSGSGYALVLGNSSTLDPFRIAKFDNGLSGTLTNVIAAATNIGTDYYSIKITYNPTNNTWELFVRSDGTAAFADPMTGSLTSQGTGVDNTYTSTVLGYMGGYWAGSTTANQFAFFDNITVQVTASGANTPPSITNIVQTPASGILSSTTVSVSADVSDSDGTVEGVELHWGTSSGNLINNIDMSLVSGNTYTTDSDIPAQAAGTTVYYEVYAIDDDTDDATSAEQSYYVNYDEPSNHVTTFIAATGTPAFSVIDVVWDDATGTVVPTGYLIKGSDVSYAAISAPVDGTPETDALLVKNIASGAEVASFTGLNENTTYYFKIFPYTNTGSNIDYKTDGTVPQDNATTAYGIPAAPVATAATNAAANSFTANWEAVAGATGYRLDVYTMTAGTNATDLFFSEYIEGGSFNKALEIYNGTGVSVDLSNYTVNLYGNGATSPTAIYTLTGMLANGEVYVLAHSSANATILAVADYTVNGGVVNFNGDDAVALVNGSTNIDVLGTIGSTAKFGENVTLVRKSSITSPNIIYSSAEWDSFAQDETSYLGSHTMSGGSTQSFVSGFENLDAGDVTSYSVTGLTPGVTYYFVVRAYNASGTSANSNEISVTTPLPVYNLVGADDVAANYSSWVNSSNEGCGFGAWSLSSGGNAGFFLGNPGSAGINGLPDPSFGLYANPAGSNYADANRSFVAPLGIGSTLSVTWGVNWDSDGSGNKGINLYTGGISGTEIININMGGSAAITINGNPMFNNYGTSAMSLNFEYVSAGNLRVYGTGRDGSETYDQTIVVAGAPDAIRFYASGLAAGDERQPYFNNLQIVTDPSGIPAASSVFVKGCVELAENFEVEDLTIEAGNTLQVDAGIDLTVNGFFSNQAGASSLVLKSDASASASLIHSTGNVPATVERYISGHNNVADAGWHLLGSPVAAFDIDDSSFDPGASDDFYAWQESNSTWMNHKQGTPSQIVPGAGYLVSYETSGAKTFTGALNAADQTVTVTREGAGDYAGFNLIGNPFASAITWGNGWSLGSVGGVAYVWDEATKDYIDIEAGDPIPSANGVMVYLGGEETSQSLTIPAAARIHSSQGWYKSAGGRIVLVANDPDRGAAKRSVIRFNESATEGFDLAWDGYYLRGFAPGFYSVSNGMNYSVNTLPSMNNTLVIPMGFEKTVSSGFSIELQESIPGAVVYLTDKKTGTVTNLTDNGAYHFTAAEGDDANRFTLHFGTLGMDDPSTAAPVHIYAYGGVVYLNGLDAKASVTITDLTGRVVMAERVNGNGLAMLNAGSLPKGVYVVTAVAGSQVVSAKVIL